MNKFRDFLSGSNRHTFTTHKLPDGRYKVTTENQTFKDKEWFGESEQDAMLNAKQALHEAALKGEL